MSCGLTSLSCGGDGLQMAASDGNGVRIISIVGELVLFIVAKVAGII